MTTLSEAQGAWLFFYGTGDVITEKFLSIDYEPIRKKNFSQKEDGHEKRGWTSVLSNRCDSTSFKKVLPDLYKAYTKQVSSRRFSISV